MDALSIILKTKMIAIARRIYGSDLVSASKALYDGGIRAFEVAFEQDKPIELTVKAIEELRAALPADAAVGAGTVMTVGQAEAAHRAGASFVISPNTSPDVIKKTKELSMVSVPGAMTPTEIAFAQSLGADIVKLFPAGVLGIEYFKAVKAPLKTIPLAAVAGITEKNIKGFSDAGAAAFGISSSLFRTELIEKGDFDRIRSAAEGFIRALSD
ncbi:MAG: bifunctional 4-hydroxy-2-oxoglutarate aldolase/2-dehydro-3-deoxy-phosphogluconate aldolase [Clostridia bacterium]|nr:bifunctional 4-hydroxy-2-oxoglutarate aldolase/2-dehydro-3-deoxy-phosphogluconate aldolase [Clostridia bacterium]